MKQLYKVRVFADVMVVADTEQKAIKDALYHALNDTCDIGLEEESTQVVTSLSDVPKDWRDSLPYGDNEAESTCEEWLAGGAA